MRRRSSRRRHVVNCRTKEVGAVDDEAAPVVAIVIAALARNSPLKFVPRGSRSARGRSSGREFAVGRRALSRAREFPRTRERV